VLKDIDGHETYRLCVGGRTLSAAEDFSYALQALKRAKIIGERTGGGAHPSREFRLTEHFTAAIPYARSVSPITGRDWEQVGVIPDVSVSAEDALRSAYILALQELVSSVDQDKARRLSDILAKIAN
jgi:C-terminal processing protease CtpA/Prc